MTKSLSGNLNHNEIARRPIRCNVYVQLASCKAASEQGLRGTDCFIVNSLKLANAKSSSFEGDLSLAGELVRERVRELSAYRALSENFLVSLAMSDVCGCFAVGLTRQKPLSSLKLL